MSLIIGENLESHAYQVVVAHDGVEAIHRLRENPRFVSHRSVLWPPWPCPVTGNVVSK